MDNNFLVPTGLHVYDDAFGGMQRGAIHLITGNLVDRSALAMQIGLNMLENDQKVFYYPDQTDVNVIRNEWIRLAANQEDFVTEQRENHVRPEVQKRIKDWMRDSAIILEPGMLPKMSSSGLVTAGDLVRIVSSTPKNSIVILDVNYYVLEDSSQIWDKLLFISQYDNKVVIVVCAWMDEPKDFINTSIEFGEGNVLTVYGKMYKFVNKVNYIHRKNNYRLMEFPKETKYSW